MGIKDTVKTYTTNWNKELEALRIEWEGEYNRYKEKLEAKNREAKSACGKYNDKVNVINARRDIMRKELDELYSFLESFGNIGIRITPFDYVTEDSDTPKDTKDHGGAQDYGKKTKLFDSGDGLSLGVALLFNPIAGGFMKLGNDIRKAKIGRANYESYLCEFQQAKLDYEQSLKKADDQIKIYCDATKIAEIYRVMIETIVDAVDKTILPELAGVQAFMYADALTDNINYDELDSGVTLKSIMRYEGTAYESHYIFVKNAFDYYKELVKFFTEKILADLLEDSKITEEERESFNLKIEQIKKKTEQIKDSAVFCNGK